MHRVHDAAAILCMHACMHASHHASCTYMFPLHAEPERLPACLTKRVRATATWHAPHVHIQSHASLHAHPCQRVQLQHSMLFLHACSQTVDLSKAPKPTPSLGGKTIGEELSEPLILLSCVQQLTGKPPLFFVP